MTINVNQVLASILVQRDVSNFEQARDFFRPSLEHLHDPFLMRDMGKVVNRITDAIFQNEKILLYGDYDVDGTTSVALLYNFFAAHHFNIDFYIPDRYTEGYGLSKKGIHWASDNGFSLIISLDCGIRSVEIAKIAGELEIDLIITDHHLPGDELPDAYAVLDPKRTDCQYPFKELSGCGVAFKILQAYCIQNGVEDDQLMNLLDLVAVSIAADIVPIVGENRVLSHFGLKKLNQNPSPGIKSLIDLTGYKGKIDISSIVFGIAPRINAIGRLDHASSAVDLLTADDTETIEDLSLLLNTKNAERRNLDSSITKEAIEIIEANNELKTGFSTILFNPDWNKGVIGIVASRCIERYYRPTIIMTESGGKATGSARSIPGFDLHEALTLCSEYLDQYGGHKYAAGLTMSIDKIRPFRKKFEAVVKSRLKPEDLIPSLDIDAEVRLDRITEKFYGILEQMSPFGPKNMRPVFLARDLYVEEDPKVMKEEHIGFEVFQVGNERSHRAIGFGLGKLADQITKEKSFSMVFTIELNMFRGNKSLQLNIKDIDFN